MRNRMICPECHRISVIYDHIRQIDRCLWKDCNWNNLDDDRKPLEKYTKTFRPAIVEHPELFEVRRPAHGQP